VELQPYSVAVRRRGEEIRDRARRAGHHA
jgi:hypothetical protein